MDCRQYGMVVYISFKLKVSANNRWVKLESGIARWGSMEADISTKQCSMSHIHVLICRAHDPAADQMTELAAFPTQRLMNAKR